MGSVPRFFHDLVLCLEGEMSLDPPKFSFNKVHVLNIKPDKFSFFFPALNNRIV